MASRESGLDVLQAWHLHEPGSPVAWDRVYVGRLLGPVRRTLAACGPLPPRPVLNGLERIRHRADAPALPLPTAALLAAWAREHPGLEVRGDGRLALTGHDGPAPALLTASTDRPLAAELAAGPVPVHTLMDALVQAGLCATHSAAKTCLQAAPYLRSVRRGLVALSR